MKIKRVSGCVADHLEVDGVDIRNIDDEELKGIVMILFDVYRNELMQESTSYIISTLLDHINPQHAEFDEEPCDQCGDSIETEVWEV